MATTGTTHTWTPGTSGDWNTSGDWTNGVPTATTDVAVLAAGTSGTAGSYAVAISSPETFKIATLDIGEATTAHSHPSLSISGKLTLTGLAYTTTASGGSSPITINAGGLLDVTSSIQNASGVAETITIAGTGTGGELELGSTFVDNAHTAYQFSNNASGQNAGEIKFDGFSSTAAQHISGVAWGDRLVFTPAQKFTGDTFSYSGTTLTVKSGTTTVLTMSNVSAAAGTSFVGSGNTIVAVCFARGTLIETSGGQVAVERLRAGDQIVTMTDGAALHRPVKWLGHRRIDLAAHPRPETVAPIRILGGAFADNLPARDLLVSPDHAIFVDGVLIAARQLVNGASIRQESDWTAVEYFHVELDAHAILLAEGLPAESYLDTDNRGFFANSGAPLTLHPNLTEDRSTRSRVAGACAPFVVDEAAVRPIWQRLAARSAELGHAAPGLATTTDADLRLLAKGREIRPIYGRNGLYIFPLPLGVTSARLLSRAASPAQARPWLDDRRELGVSVARLVLRAPEEVLDIAIDHPDLAQGWWDVQTDGTMANCWTDGDALLPLPAMRGLCLLEVHLRGEMTYVVEAPAVEGGQLRAA